MKIIERRKLIEQCVGVFVSRFHPKTTEKDVVETIREQTGLTLKVEKLRSKYDTYTSFCIRCSPRLRSMILDPYMWGCGAVVREYTERI